MVALLLLSGLSSLASGSPVVGAPAHPGSPAGPPTPSTSPVPGRTLPATAPVWNGSASVPSWPTYLGNDARTSVDPGTTTLNVSDLGNLTERWGLDLNGSMFSTPTYVNGTIYFGDWNGYEYAYNITRGEMQWDTFLGTSSTCYVGGTESTPTLWNHTLYVGAGDDHWDALNATTGEIEWRVDVSSPGNFDWASPLVYDGALYIGIASCDDAPLVQGKLLEVNLSGDHSVLHEFDTVPKGTVGSTIWATPTLDRKNNTIWVATGNDDGKSQTYAQSIVGLNATTLAVLGSWQVPNVVGQDQDFGATPTLLHDASGRELIVDTNKDGDVYALNASNVTTNGSWKPVWQLWLGDGPLYSPAAFDGTTLYEAGSNVTLNGTSYSSSVRALDPTNGTAKWTVGTDAGAIYGAEVYSHGFVVDAAGSYLELRNASTGALISHLQVPSPRGDDFVVEGSPIVVDGQVIVDAGDSSGAPAGGLFDFALPLVAGALRSSPSGRDAPYAASFSATAFGGIPPYNVTWDFGDGSVGAGASASHRFTSPGTFLVVANVTDLTGATVQLNTTVVVYPPLVAMIAGGPFGPHLAPLTVDLTAVPTGGIGPPYNLTWAFGDGTPDAYGSEVEHVYEAPGDYVAALTTEDSTGATAIATLNLTVVAPLELSLSAPWTSGELPVTVNFSATELFGLAPIDLNWAFGDGGTQAGGLEASHTYESSGQFLVTLTGTDAIGDHVVLTTNVTVYPAAGAPEIFATTVSTSCAPVMGTSVQLNFTTVGGLGPFGGTWEFGDGSSAAASNITHFYRSNGTFRVNLTLTDEFGRTVTASQAVTVSGPDCTVLAPPPSHGTTPSGSPPGPSVWEYALLAGAGLAVVAAATVVAVRRRRRA